MIMNIYYNIDGMIVVVHHTSNDMYERWFDSIIIEIDAQTLDIKLWYTMQQSTIYFAASCPIIRRAVVQALPSSSY